MVHVATGATQFKSLTAETSTFISWYLQLVVIGDTAAQARLVSKHVSISVKLGVVEVSV